MSSAQSPIHEDDGIQRLVLSRCGDSPVHSQVRQERPHLVGSHLTRVPLVVEQDEPLDPADVGLFPAVGKALDPAGVGDLIEKPRSPGFGR